MLRILLFIGTNVLVIATISILFSLLGLNQYLSQKGIDYYTLAIMCALWGTGGAFFSLFLSKQIAKTSMGVVLIDPKQATREELFLINIVYDLAKRVGITTMPDVGIYQANELNAFATGPSKNNALVAVSSGLLSSMNREEIAAVLGHEISHVANGDMVTMTLVQGIINSFALFFSRIIAYAISFALSRHDDQSEGISYMTYSMFTFVFDIIFTLFGTILVAAYSRWREYRADAGGAMLVGKNNMIAALHRLALGAGLEDNRAPSLAALKISHYSSWFELLATHPPLEKRIQRLQKM